MSSSPKRVFIVTGANTGVGFETAKQLAVDDDANERHIILACRTASKAEAAVQKIRDLLPAGSKTVVEFMQLDLADIRSIDSFVDNFQKRNLPLHVLINNAGVNKAPILAQPTFNVEGQFVANYLAPYYLTKKLLPVLEKSAPSRVVNVTSYMHRMGRTDFETNCRLSNKSSYSNSKLAQIFHAYNLHKQYSSKGVSFFLSHPGACYSDIWNTFEPAFLQNLKPVMKMIFLSTEQGARPSVHAATKPLSSTGECEHFGPYRTPLPGWEFFTDAWQPSICGSHVTKSRTSTVTYDESIGKKLIALSDKLVAEWTDAAKKDSAQ